MSNPPSFDFASSSTSLTYPSPARLHIGGHIRVSSQEARNFTEEGWRELYESEVFLAEAPPAYQREDSSLPSYHHAVMRIPAPPARTPLTKRLLKFGFFFPLFWLLGAILMFVAIVARQNARRSSRHDSPFFLEKTRTRSELAYERMLVSEIEWGLRCTWAFCIISCIVSGILIAAMV